ncbi:MAG TPA: DUF5615 family PIN-like protein [Microvirga sp.]|jgi:predicted nuclease of predicted toxin-antitoxin system|nr:DUF5615 family PIN-like protein [Microvirga sp.]
MRFLIDMNLGLEWIEPLSGAGYQAVHWSSIGATDERDEHIMGWARDHGHVILTADLDFGSRLVRYGEAKPSVVQLRTEATLVRLVGTQVLAAIGQTQADLAAGSLVTVEEDRYRVRRLLPTENT